MGKDLVYKIFDRDSNPNFFNGDGELNIKNIKSSGYELESIYNISRHFGVYLDFEIFSLYELTLEITRCFQEEEYEEAVLYCAVYREVCSCHVVDLKNTFVIIEYS
jgi:hypothetical protein